jgi:hypothetical protein
MHLCLKRLATVTPGMSLQKKNAVSSSHEYRATSLRIPHGRVYIFAPSTVSPGGHPLNFAVKVNVVHDVAHDVAPGQ